MIVLITLKNRGQSNRQFQQYNLKMNTLLSPFLKF